MSISRNWPQLCLDDISDKEKISKGLFPHQTSYQHLEVRYHLTVIKKLQGFVSSSNFLPALGGKIPFDGNKETLPSFPFDLASLKDCHMGPRSFEGLMTLSEGGRTVFGVKTALRQLMPGESTNCFPKRKTAIHRLCGELNIPETDKLFEETAICRSL